MANSSAASTSCGSSMPDGSSGSRDLVGSVMDLMLQTRTLPSGIVEERERTEVEAAAFRTPA